MAPATGDVARYLRHQVYAYAPFHRARFDAAGVGQQIRDRGDVARLPLMTLAEIADPAPLVMRPDEDTIRRYGETRLVWRVFVGKITGRVTRLNDEVIDPVYKPLHWIIDDGVPVGSSAEDLERLAELGRSWLEWAGLTRGDVLVGLLPPGPSLAYWELVLGARRAGVSAVFLPQPVTPDHVRAAAATVVAGRPGDLRRLFEAARADGRPLDAVHTLLAAGEALSTVDREALQRLARVDAVVVNAWAPPGVRALWTECRKGDTLHLSDEYEHVEAVDGEIVWTGIEWKGTAFVRLRTGVRGELVTGRCPACRRTGTRLRAARA